MQLCLCLWAYYAVAFAALMQGGEETKNPQAQRFSQRQLAHGKWTWIQQVRPASSWRGLSGEDQTASKIQSFECLVWYS